MMAFIDFKDNIDCLRLRKMQKDTCENIQLLIHLQQLER